MATRITHTQSAATSRRKFTLSAWIKRGTITDGHDQVIYDSYNDGNNRVTFFIHSTDKLYLYSGKTWINIKFMYVSTYLPWC